MVFDNEKLKPVQRKSVPDSKLHEDMREPQQIRGKERIENILETAAQIITEEGISGISMHALAKRSKTSVGSMYHFFKDRECVLGALYERHYVSMIEIGSVLNKTPDSDWRILSADEVVERMVTPYIKYVQKHGDFLPLTYDFCPPGKDTTFLSTIRCVLNARLGMFPETMRNEYAELLNAVAVGTMYMGYKINPDKADLYLKEVPRVLTAYLSHIECNRPRI